MKPSPSITDLYPNIPFQKNQGVLFTLEKFQVLPTLFFRFVARPKLDFIIAICKTKNPIIKTKVIVSWKKKIIASIEYVAGSGKD